MLDSFPSRKLDIDGADIDVRIRYRPIKQYGNYQSDVVSDGAGGVSGGGTVFHSWITDGVAIRVSNRSTEMRSYQFGVVVFKNLRRKLIDRKFNATIYDLKPGYTEDLVVELFDGERLGQSVLEDLWVKDAKRGALAHFQPMAILGQYAKFSKLFPPLYRLRRPAIYVALFVAVFTVAYRWARSF